MFKDMDQRCGQGRYIHVGWGSCTHKFPYKITFAKNMFISKIMANEQPWYESHWEFVGSGEENLKKKFTFHFLIEQGSNTCLRP